MAVEENSGGSQNSRPTLPGQVVLVLQGGGALAAYQVGIYDALHAAGIEPDWVIGTSIGAINGAIIAGNTFERRMDCLRKLWALIEQKSFGAGQLWPWINNSVTNVDTLLRGIPGLFAPNPAAAWGMHAHLGAEQAAFYSTEALRSTLLWKFESCQPSHGVRSRAGLFRRRTPASASCAAADEMTPCMSCLPKEHRRSPQ
jgi:NTE family protein